MRSLYVFVGLLAAVSAQDFCYNDVVAGCQGLNGESKFISHFCLLLSIGQRVFHRRSCLFWIESISEMRTLLSTTVGVHPRQSTVFKYAVCRSPNQQMQIICFFIFPSHLFAIFILVMRNWTNKQRSVETFFFYFRERRRRCACECTLAFIAVPCHFSRISEFIKFNSTLCVLHSRRCEALAI